jgi:hypothetical protein
MSQMLTLYSTPVVYLLLDRGRLWVKKWWHGTVPDAAPEAS